MNPLLKKTMALAIGISVLWFASEWWEKQMAPAVAPALISPNGCYRLETFKPFWLLPDILHRKADPNNDTEPKWLPWWGYPGFFRLFDNRSGELLGESDIYDLEQASGDIDWGVTGSVYVGMIFVGPNTKDCIFDRPAELARECESGFTAAFSTARRPDKLPKWPARRATARRQGGKRTPQKQSCSRTTKRSTRIRRTTQST